MTRSKRVPREMGKLSKTGTIGVAGLVLLLGTTVTWAGPPPNPTASDPVLLNTAGGTDALSSVTTGIDNTAFGFDALIHNMDGKDNTAFGFRALFTNDTGNYNTAIGSNALISNTFGVENTASGVNALFNNKTGIINTATGHSALYSNQGGSSNTASGFEALYTNTSGDNNTATGARALRSNSEGFENTAYGADALFKTEGSLTAMAATGYNNTAVGVGALYNNITGYRNTAIGDRADVSAEGLSNGTAIGSNALVTASNSIVLGDSFITKIYAKVTAISSISDRRHKKDIKALDADLGLDFIAKLKPVSYRFNNGDETERYGFIAQDLEQALPVSLQDTIERSEPEHGLALIEQQNDKDRTYRVSYGELTAPIVKAIQQQQQEIEAVRRALEDQIATLKAENDALRHSIAALREQVTAAR